MDKRSGLLARTFLMRLTGGAKQIIKIGRKSLAFCYEFEYSKAVFRKFLQAMKIKNGSRALRLCFLLRKQLIFLGI